MAIARAAADYMAERGIENARLEAELLLASVLGLTRLELYLHHDRPLVEAEKEEFRRLVRRRVKREPLQYILGEVQFRELRLHVDPRVLIPRPETEVLVGEVLAWASKKVGSAAGWDGLTAVDIGTGSGAIALSLAKEGPFARVVATDVSADALEVARENAEGNGLADRVEFRQGSLWDALEEGERFDVIVSNPPYVAESERGALQPEVAEWEPPEALFAPGGGLSVLAALVDGAPEHLRPGGLLAVEIGLGQAQRVVERIESRGAYGTPRVVKDLAGRERVILAEVGLLA